MCSKVSTLYIKHKISQYISMITYSAHTTFACTVSNIQRIPCPSSHNYVLYNSSCSDIYIVLKAIVSRWLYSLYYGKSLFAPNLVLFKWKATTLTIFYSDTYCCLNHTCRMCHLVQLGPWCWIYTYSERGCIANTIEYHILIKHSESFFKGMDYLWKIMGTWSKIWCVHGYFKTLLYKCAF